MLFPKKIMKKSELLKIGIPRQILMDASSNRKICWKMNPAKSNSHLLYDTEELQKYIDKLQKVNAMIDKHVSVC